MVWRWEEKEKETGWKTATKSEVTNKTDNKQRKEYNRNIKQVREFIDPNSDRVWWCRAAVICIPERVWILLLNNDFNMKDENAIQSWTSDAGQKAVKYFESYFLGLFEGKTNGD